MKDTGLTTKITVSVTIDEIKGTCPKCGGSLELRDQVCAWKEDGTPSEEDTYKTPYCPRCKLFWVGQPE